MRILLSVFAISPTRGSEPGVGWQCATRLAREHDVTILYGDLNTAARSKHELEAWVRDHPEAPRMTLAYVAPSRLSLICERLHAKPGLRPLYYWGYQLWQKRALAVARGLHRTAPFDLVHQLTYATYWEPGYLWKLGIPFFWGPISGGNVLPLRYIPILGAKGSVEAVARFILNRITLLTHPRIGAAARRASHIWCVTSAEKKKLSRYSKRISTMSEAGTSQSETSLRSLAPGQALQIVWSGLHIERKALPILIHAVAQLNPGSNVMVHVLGAGRGNSTQTEKAKALAARLGVSSKIIWYGNLPRDRALERMSKGHVLVHTSLLEATSCVVMEALSSGMPIICHDACGMATVVTSSCGIKVPMTGVRDSIRGFRDAIQTLIDDPARLKHLSEGALQRSQTLTWEKKNLEFNLAYAQVVKHPKNCT
jgi:glycosyltransferase involved in cell wall biosynthesis